MSVERLEPPCRTESFTGYILKMPNNTFLQVHWMQRSDQTCFGIYDIVPDFTLATAMPQRAVQEVLKDLRTRSDLPAPVALLEMTVTKTFILTEVPLDGNKVEALPQIPQA